MATRIKGEPGRIVWMPAGDSAKEVRESKNPNGPFVAVSRDGELLPAFRVTASERWMMLTFAPYSLIV
jgi:hypothetical protein